MSSSMSPPTAHRAATVTLQPEPQIVIKERPVPSVDSDELLVKVRAVTLNPADWKHVWEWGALKEGDSLGCDFAGDIVLVGKAAESKGFKVGDAVAGFLRGGIPNRDVGTFQEYTKIPADLVWHVPTEVLSYEDAAAMGGISLSTVAQSFWRLGLPYPWAPVKPDHSFPVLIWSGATAVGIYAIRVAKISGLRVATTASPANHALMKQLGADIVLDYRDPDTPKKLKDWSKGQIRHAVDCISEHGSTKLVAEAFSDDGGKVVTMFPVSKTSLEPITNVDTIHMFIYASLEKLNKADYEHLSEWYRNFPPYASQLKVMPLFKRPGGLDGIPAAVEEVKAGKVKAGKISVAF